MVTLVVMALVTACGTTNDGGPIASPEPTPGEDGTDAEPSDGSSGGDSPPAPAQAGERPPPDSPDAAALADGLNDVGYRIFEAATRQSDDDVVLSPLSIGVAFGMADAGASGATAEALADLFLYPVDGEDRWAAFNTLEQTVTSVEDATVRLANRQFPDESFTTAPGYDEVLGRWFGAGVEPLPLQADSEGSRQHINQWVADRTEGLIPDLLPDGFVDESSVLVLVNALYLDAPWQKPFGKYPTNPATFTRLDGSEVSVPMMHELELAGPAVSTDDYAATEVPYEGGELSMLVIVPTEGQFDDVQARLSAGLVDDIDAEAATQAVELFLPRFESNVHVDLRGLIEDDLGVGDVFGVAGFDGIAPGITLEDAVHAADISVDEYGTVAAAATGLGFNESGPPAPDITVRADRPFLYIIRHVPTGAALFVGRVMDPEV